MIKVLVVHPNRNDATCYYRALGPLQRMHNDGLIEVIDGTVPGYEFSWPNLLKCDIVFFQRPCSKEHIDIMKMCKQMNKPVWLDTDDDYLNIPIDNPRHNDYHIEGRQYLIQDCIEMADVVTVSTEAIVESYKKYNQNIIVIPNAYDDSMFAPPAKRAPEKVVLARFGDTHKKNFEFYKDDILKCFFEHPEYTWVMMGESTPEWLTDNPDVPNDRIKLYHFTDLFQYFDYLMEIHPEIVIAPLEDTQFNRSRSNNAWIEGTLAGAVVVATELPEFTRVGVVPAPKASFKAGFDFAVTCNQEMYFEASKQSIPTLSKINQLRMYVIDELVKKFKSKRITPKKIENKLPYSDEYFFTYCLKMGWTQETEKHRMANIKAVDWMLETFKPERVLELGSGPGLMLERFHQEQIYALGVELNPFFVEYFQKRNPLTKHLVIQGDITEEMVFEEPFDLVISIEVFEHIYQPEEKWDAMLTRLAQNAKWFIFSSTPFRYGREFDKQWGHSNVRLMSKWIELFERNGWEFHSNPNKIITWDLVFQSTIFGAEVIEVKE